MFLEREYHRKLRTINARSALRQCEVMTGECHFQNEQRAKVQEFIKLYKNLNGLLEYPKSAIKACGMGKRLGLWSKEVWRWAKGLKWGVWLKSPPREEPPKCVSQG